MPSDVDDCVESVLEDNPDYSESRAWAICKAQQEGDVEDDAVEVEQLGDIRFSAEDLGSFVDQSDSWSRHESEQGVAWVDTEAALAVFEPDVESSESQQADDFALDVIRVVQEGDDGPVEDGALLALGADMPNAGVYVDWNNEAWPEDEQLERPHVSDYGTVEDLEQATGGVVSVVDTTDATEALQTTVEQQLAEVDAVALEFPPGGEVIDHEAGDWEAFLDDLSAHGDVFQMWKGLQRHPEDNLESHDHTTYVALEAGADVVDVEAVLEEHPAVHYTIRASSVDPMDRPDDWEPVESDHYHGVVDVDQQAVVVSGLSQEAQTAMERRYNVTIRGHRGGL